MYSFLSCPITPPEEVIALNKRGQVLEVYLYSNECLTPRQDGAAWEILLVMNRPPKP